jgi:hypothetical protein
MASITLKCSFCGYMPVSAIYWEKCPKCGNARPPDASPYAGRGALLGLGIGGFVGAACGYVAFGSGLEGALGGALLGAIPGVLLVLVIRLATAAASRLSGRR